jgi:hypothetical protein
MGIVPAQAISVVAASDGLVTCLYIVRLQDSIAEAFLAYSDSRSAPAHPDEPTFEARYAKKHNLPLEKNPTTSRILKDFADGTLKTFPSDAPVPPGTDLKA